MEVENYLEERPHHRLPLIIILVCVIVVSFVYAVSMLFGLKYQNNSSPANLSIAEQKEIVVDRLRDATKHPLTPQERANIVNFVSRGGATYTAAEKVELTRILRAQ